MGGLFGRRRGGNVTIVNDNSALIRQLIASNEENHKRFMALMEESEKSHKEYMKILSDEIQHTKEQNQKVINELKEDFRRKDEEYENKKRQKKELRQKEVNKQLLNEINDSKAFILKDCENEFDKMKDIYCLKEINNIKISEDIEELFLKMSRKYFFKKF